MDDRVLAVQLEELIKETSGICLDEESDQRICKIISGPQPCDGASMEWNNLEGIDFLRINVKYLLFDLEVTRKENAMLRHLLEDEPKSETVNDEHNNLLAEDHKPSQIDRQKDPDVRLCPYCSQPLCTPKAKQCLKCHMDWHNPDKVFKHEVKDKEEKPRDESQDSS